MMFDICSGRVLGSARSWLVLQTINRRCFENHGDSPYYDRRTIPYDYCAGIPISHLIEVKACFVSNQEKSQVVVGSFSVLWKHRRLIVCSTNIYITVIITLQTQSIQQAVCPSHHPPCMYQSMLKIELLKYIYVITYYKGASPHVIRRLSPWNCIQ